MYLGEVRGSVVSALGNGNSARIACSVTSTREFRPKTTEAGSVGWPGVSPFHSNEEVEISAVFAGGRF